MKALREARSGSHELWGVGRGGGEWRGAFRAEGREHEEAKGAEVRKRRQWWD